MQPTSPTNTVGDDKPAHEKDTPNSQLPAIGAVTVMTILFAITAAIRIERFAVKSFPYFVFETYLATCFIALLSPLMILVATLPAILLVVQIKETWPRTRWSQLFMTWCAMIVLMLVVGSVVPDEYFQHGNHRRRDSIEWTGIFIVDSYHKGFLITLATLIMAAVAILPAMGLYECMKKVVKDDE
jgi:hypothetical protein